MNSGNQKDLIEHIHRYHLGLPAFIAASFDCDGIQTEEAATATLAELREAGLVDCAPLYPGYREEQYFYLTEAGAALVDEPDAKFGPLTKTNRLRAFAMASFCCLSDTKRYRVTSHEFRTSNAGIWYPPQTTDYCIEPDEGRLGYLKPDLGGQSAWDRVVDSAIDFIKKRLTHRDKAYARAWQQMFEKNQFVVYVFTSHQHKATRINEQIALRAERGPPEGGVSLTATSVQAFVIPGLFDLIHPRPS